MVKTLSIIIENDSVYSASYYVTVNGEHVEGYKFEDEIKYKYETTENNCNVNIFVEDKWSDKNKVQKVLMCLYIFDFEFGNAMENLPLSADLSKEVVFDEQDNKKVVLKSNDFLKVAKQSLSLWNSCAIAQSIIVVVAMTVIMIILSFIFAGIAKIAFFVASTLLISLISVLLNKKRKSTLRQLELLLE